VLIETPRLRLVACSVEVAVALVADAPELATGLLRADLAPDFPTPDLVSLLRGYAEALARDPALLGWGPWIVVEDGHVVGSVGFHGPPTHGSVELGYGIAADASGRGIATEAAQALVAWARTDPRVDTIVAETEPGNAASRRVLEKLGMQPAQPTGDADRWTLACNG
jgi:RimJ/RimL family protein N-acetyltransferase